TFRHSLRCENPRKGDRRLGVLDEIWPKRNGGPVSVRRRRPDEREGAHAPGLAGHGAQIIGLDPSAVITVW
ncbi:hypothetical protein, partial [Streptomyces sp. wa22]|uniref:hypothetical protein n=1 Tax=Streptomyces sp. wa22 TaxID=1828244 RepID=UPI001C9D1313